jgi:Holliday junction resolvase RusA-like endonuclease
MARKHTQRYKLKPKAKQRPRMTRYGRAYTPKATHIFENAVAAGWNKNYWYGDSPIAIQIVLDKDGFTVTIGEHKTDTPKSPLRGDIDNYAKSILDGLNGVAFKDDSQVRSLTVVKL